MMRRSPTPAPPRHRPRLDIGPGAARGPAVPRRRSPRLRRPASGLGNGHVRGYGQEMKLPDDHDGGAPQVPAAADSSWVRSQAPDVTGMGERPPQWRGEGTRPAAAAVAAALDRKSTRLN